MRWCALPDPKPTRRISRPQRKTSSHHPPPRGEPQPLPKLPDGAPQRPLPDDPDGASWAVVARDRTAEERWQQLCAQLGGNCQRAYDQLVIDPKYQDGRRWIKLRGSKYEGLYQHEIGGGQRLWYRLDEERRVVVIEPWTAHPKETEA